MLDRRRRIPRRGIAGESESGVTVLGLDCGLAVEVHQGTRNPLGLRSGLDRGSGGLCDGAGGCAWRSIAGVSSRGLWGALLTKVASAEGRGGCCVAHRGSNRGMA